MSRALCLAAVWALVALAAPCLAQGPRLPEAAQPARVQALLAAPDAGLDVVDVRPAAEFADYSLPGSVNQDPAGVLADQALLAGTGPLLLVDRDATVALPLAGMLAAKTSRPVVVLAGGLKAWWAWTEKGMAVREVPLAAPARPDAPAAPAKPVAPAKPAAPAPKPPTAKSAGC